MKKSIFSAMIVFSLFLNQTGISAQEFPAGITVRMKKEIDELKAEFKEMKEIFDKFIKDSDDSQGALDSHEIDQNTGIQQIKKRLYKLEEKFKVNFAGKVDQESEVEKIKEELANAKKEVEELKKEIQKQQEEQKKLEKEKTEEKKPLEILDELKEKKEPKEVLGLSSLGFSSATWLSYIDAVYTGLGGGGGLSFRVKETWGMKVLFGISPAKSLGMLLETSIAVKIGEKEKLLILAVMTVDDLKVKYSEERLKSENKPSYIGQFGGGAGIEFALWENVSFAIEWFAGAGVTDDINGKRRSKFTMGLVTSLDFNFLHLLF